MSQSRNSISPSEKPQSQPSAKKSTGYSLDENQQQNRQDLRRFWSGFLNLDRFSHEFFLKSSFESLRHQDLQKFYVPESDVFESIESFTVVIDLPGVSSQDLHIELSDELLKVYGRRELRTQFSEKTGQASTRSHGDFLKEFRLPESVNIDQVSVNFKRGVLSISMAKNRNL